jgi:hypothetical protein
VKLIRKNLHSKRKLSPNFLSCWFATSYLIIRGLDTFGIILAFSKCLMLIWYFVWLSRVSVTDSHIHSELRRNLFAVFYFTLLKDGFCIKEWFFKQPDIDPLVVVEFCWPTSAWIMFWAFASCMQWIISVLVDVHACKQLYWWFHV